MFFPKKITPPGWIVRRFSSNHGVIEVLSAAITKSCAIFCVKVIRAIVFSTSLAISGEETCAKAPSGSSALAATAPAAANSARRDAAPRDNEAWRSTEPSCAPPENRKAGSSFRSCMAFADHLWKMLGDDRRLGLRLDTDSGD